MSTSSSSNQRTIYAQMRHSITGSLLVSLTFVAILGVGMAQGETKYSDREYIIDSWETSDGLPENSATAMVQTPDGYLWFGTFNGLVRYDGMRFTVYDTSNTPALPSSGIVNLHLDASLRLWISTLRGLMVSEPNLWLTLRREPAFTGNYVRTFSENAGVLCITSFDGKVFRSQAGRFEELPEPPGNRGRGYRGYVDQTGRIWILQAGFFGYWDGSQWQLSRRADQVTNGFLSSTPLRDGRLLVLIAAEPKRMELLKIDQERVTSRIQVPLSRKLGDVWSINDDSQGNIWICATGLYRVLPSAEIRYYSSSNGLTRDSLRFTFEDREGNLWIGTNSGGIIRFKKRTFQSYGKESGLSELNIKAIAEQAPGKMQAGSYSGDCGLFQLEEGGLWQEMPAGRRLRSKYVQCLLQDHENNLWIGSFGSYYSNEPPGKALSIFTPREQIFISTEDSGGSSVSALFQDSQGRVWIGGSQTISVFSRGKFQRQQAPLGNQLSEVRYFAEDRLDGAIWAGGTEGLFRFAGGGWQEIKNSQGQSIKEILCLRTEHDGSLWISAAQAGLLRFKQGQWSSITEAQGLPARNVGSILADDLGYWWLGTNRGVVRASSEDFARLADGLLKNLPHQLFTLSDGLPSVECTMGYQSTGIKDSQGRLWFTTLKGIAMVDPRQLHLNSIPPPVVLESLSFIDRQGHLHNLATSRSAVTNGPAIDEEEPTFIIPPGGMQLAAYIAVLSHSAAEKNRLRYRLTQGDQLLLEGEQSARRISAQWLPPGNYRIHVTAANNDGVWNEKGVSLAVILQPFFWETLWFRLLVLIGFSGSLGFASWQITRSRLQRRIENLEQKRALQQERDRLASVMEATSDFVAFADSESRLLFINAAGRSMVGLSASEEIQGKRLGDMHPPGVRKQFFETYLPAAIRDGIWEGETILLNRNGDEIPVSQVLVAHRGSDGEVNFLSTISRDITERKRAEAERERLAMAIEQAAELMIITDAQGTIQYVNPAFTRVTGYSSSEALGQNPRLLKSGEQDQAFYRNLWSTITAGETWTGQFINKKKDGSRYTEEATISPIRDRTGAIINFVAVKRDISEEIKTLAQSEALKEQLRQSQKMESVGRLAGGVAHDFNNMLQAILGHSELALGQIKAEDPLCEHLEEIQKSARRSADLTRQLLAFARKQPINPKILDLNEVVEGMLKMLRRLIGENIQLTWLPGSNLWKVRIDPSQLDQILANLSVNARDAITGAGQITLETANFLLDDTYAASHPECLPGDYVMLAVTDNGHGIDAETKSHLFEPFFTTKKPGEGTGLGLATVFGVVKQNQGFINVYSEPGAGASFKIYLPRSNEEGGRKLQEEAPMRGTETILLVEDEEQILRLAQRILQQLGYNVLVARLPQQAVDMARQYSGPIHLLATDVVMPGMNGKELKERIEGIRPGIKCLYISGYSADVIAHHGVIGEGLQFLQKPFTVRTLSAKVREALDI